MWDRQFCRAIAPPDEDISYCDPPKGKTLSQKGRYKATRVGKDAKGIRETLSIGKERRRHQESAIAEKDGHVQGSLVRTESQPRRYGGR